MRATVQPAETTETTEGIAAPSVRLSVELEDEEFQEALDATVRKLSAQVRVPGFRPGKVPRKLLEARVGTEALRMEALQEALPDLYERALRENDVDAIAPPTIDIVSGQQSGPVAFDAVVQVRPLVSIAGYQGLQVTAPSAEVTEEDVEAQIDRIRDQLAELVAVARPARDGDHVSIDVKAYRHQQVIDALTADDYLYEVGSGSIVPELDQQLRGSRTGDIFKFNAVVDAGATDAGGVEGADPASGGPREGSPAVREIAFQVLVKDVKEKVLPEANDEWAADASEFDTVAALRADTRHRLETLRALQARVTFRERAVEALVDLVSDDVPEVLVDKEVSDRLHELSHRLERQQLTLGQYLETTGQDPEQVVASLREPARVLVKADLALRALAEAEGIEVTEEDLGGEIDRMAQELGRRPDQVRRQLEHADRLGAVRSEVRKSRAITWLLDNVALVDESGAPVEGAGLRPSEQAAVEGQVEGTTSGDARDAAVEPRPGSSAAVEA